MTKILVLEDDLVAQLLQQLPASGHQAIAALRASIKMEFGNMNLACRVKIFESIGLEKGNGHVYAMVMETCKELMKEIKGVQLTEYEDF
ncbi:hypothetical protein C8R47DRAFT_1209064 [Mycena vitilis]|nr:hypothetical protein C8R47DRAFT_1209064 [Mycena vitilis]